MDTEKEAKSLAWGKRVDKAFRERVFQLCRNLSWPVETHADFVMACIAFESAGTFSASVRNPQSSAVGLVQFMASTARALGTTTSKLVAMSEVEQLEWVERYFRPYAKRIKTLEDMYMSILWPAAIGRSADAVLWKYNTGEYRVNSGLDTNKNGYITVGEAAGKVRERLEAGRLPENLWVAGDDEGPTETNSSVEAAISTVADSDQLSKNFHRSEFACKDGCGADRVKQDLVDVLQKMRDIIGKPIAVNSGVRCERHNRNVGGENHSKHLLGEAADIKVEGMTPKQVAAVAKKVLGSRRGGIKVYSTFTHVDVRRVPWRSGI